MRSLLTRLFWALYLFVPSRKTQVDFASFCEIGDRATNEDAILAVKKDERYVFVVADGLGGHTHGDLASKKLVEVFLEELPQAKCCRSYLDTAFHKAQQQVLALQQEFGAKNRIKTTAAALVIIGDKCAWGHVGDTRLYFFSKNKQKSRTIDDSVPQALALYGEIEDGDIATHPDRSRLLSAIGDISANFKYEASRVMRLRQGYSFFICSDGVWEICQPQAPKSGSAQEWLDGIAKSIKAGESMGKDNNSAIAIILKAKEKTL